MAGRVPVVLVGIVLVGIALRVGLGIHESGRSGDERSRVTWHPAPVAPIEAERTGRPLLYDFSADWCRPCKHMSREVFNDAEAGAWIDETFVAVRVEDGLENDGLSDEEAAVLRVRWSVEAFPTLLVLREGEVTGRLVGYPSREGTLEFLEAQAARER